MVFKPTKTFLNEPAQKILGHVISKEGRSTDPGLVRAIKELQSPTTITQVRSLLGLAQVAREYIPALSTVISPLQALARKGVDIPSTWDTVLLSSI